MVLLALAALAATALPAAASARPRLLVGLFDDAQVYYNPAKAFPLMRSLRTQVVRINMYWGGRLGGTPPTPTLPRLDDPAAYGPSDRPSVGYAALGRTFTAPADKGARYSYALLQPWDVAQARTLAAASPDVETLAYKNIAATFASATTDGKDNANGPSGVGYAAAAADHPDWFLTDANGERVESCAHSGRFLMDVGNGDYQAAWLEAVSSELHDGGWGGVVLDGASWSPAADLCGRALAKYPTDAAYTAAVDSFLANVATALRERGFAVFADLRVPQTADGLALWNRWLSYVSGAVLDGWGSERGAAWSFDQSLQVATQSAGKPFLALDSGSDAAAVDYARASFLLGWSAAPSALVVDGNPPPADAGVEVGKPLGPARQVGAAWQRDFTQGTVVVNPSDQAVTVPLDNTYMTPDGHAVSSLTLQPGAGLTLRLPDLVGGDDNAVARRRPRDATNPADPAYDWSLYDRTVRLATANHIAPVVTILGTPTWANGGLGFKHAPSNPDELTAFAYAAAKRYSGTYPGPDGKPLPAVRMWLAWNEPNNPVFLQPQYKRVDGRWVVQSARDYARICAAVYRGVHATLLRGEKVGCGLTAPRGSNAPASSRPSVTPLLFLRELKRDGLKTFDAYAHHPYYNLPNDTPTSQPHNRGAVEMGNIGALVKELTKLYGKKRIWITEYGYQTNDPKFGVSWRTQAKYLREAYDVARRTGRIDMLIWFLLRDDAHVKSGWQSGFFTAKGKRKPAANVFKSLPR
jgi:hypothetical protein